MTGCGAVVRFSRQVTFNAMTDMPYDIHDLGWLTNSACTQPDSDVDVNSFFTDSGHILDADDLEMCRACPVRSECLAHAYQYNHTGGYFGGLSSQKRSEMTLEQALAWAQADSALAGTGRRRVPKPTMAKIFSGELRPTGHAARVLELTSRRIEFMRTLGVGQVADDTVDVEATAPDPVPA